MVSRSHTDSVEMGWPQPVMWSQIIPDRLPGFWKHPRAAGGMVSRTKATFFMPAHMNLGLGDQTPVFKELVKSAVDRRLGNQTLKIERLGTHGGSWPGAHRGVRRLSSMQREVKRRGSWSCPSRGALCLSTESRSSQLACLSEQGRLSLSLAEDLLGWGVQRGAHLLVPAPTGGALKVLLTP